MFGSTKRTLTTAADALAGRSTALPDILNRHEVLGTSMHGPWPAGTQILYVAMGCFWGAERIFWKLPGVVTTAVGYMGGFTPNPTSCLEGEFCSYDQGAMCGWADAPGVCAPLPQACTNGAVGGVVSDGGVPSGGRPNPDRM